MKLNGPTTLSGRKTVLTATLLVGVTLWSGFSHALGEAISKRLEVTSEEQISIIVPRGKVKVEGTQSNYFEVTGNLDEKLEELVMDSSDGVTRFEVVIPEHLNQGKEKEESNLSFKVPQGALITMEGTNTDISMMTLQGQSSAKTVNGDIAFKTMENQLNVSTVNGDVEGREISATTELKSVNGDIELFKAVGVFELASVNGDMELELESDNIKVELVNGDLELSLTQGQTATLNNVNGDIEASLLDAKAPEIQLSTVNGDATLKLSDKVSAQFKLSAKVGGDIDNNFNQLKPQTNEYGPGEWLNFSTGEGVGHITMSTVNGSLELEKL